MLEDRFVDVITALKQGTANDIVPWKPSAGDRNNKSFVTAVGDWSYEIRELENGDISLNFLKGTSERLDGFVSPRDDARYRVVESLFHAARDRHESHVTASLKAAAGEIKRRLKEAGLEAAPERCGARYGDGTARKNGRDWLEAPAHLATKRSTLTV